MRAILSLAGTALLAVPAAASDMEIELEIPRLRVAEYHRPYVAIWIAREDQSVAANLAVWYQLTAGPEGDGKTWLKDIRMWWRRIGRTLDMPVDGVSGPTRPPATHTLEIPQDDPRLRDLEPGHYFLFVEASREVGGRELLEIPFEWAPDASSETTIEGDTELGRITLRLTAN